MADYTLGGLTARVQNRVRDTAFSSTQIHDFINDVQRQIFNKHTLPFMEKEVAGSLTVGANEYDLQTDHSTTLGLSIQHPTNLTDIIDIGNNYIPYRDFFKRFPDREETPNARPHYWTEYKQNLVFDVQVDLGYNLYHRYSKAADALVNTTDIPELPEKYGELLVLGAVIRTHKQKDNWDFAALVQQDYDELEEEMLIREGERQRATPVFIRHAMKGSIIPKLRGS